MTTSLVKSHKILAQKIQDKKILHLNSYGKDAVLTLDWLYNYAKIKNIVSIHFGLLPPHPKDKTYLDYLKKKYPRVSFITKPNPNSLTSILQGVFQSPDDWFFHNSLNYEAFFYKDSIKTWLKEYNCNLVAIGKSRYESFSRATFFHKYGLMKGNEIYPLGMMSKDQVFALLKNIKLHPVYKLTDHTLDTPSYYQMRSNFLAYPEYYELFKKYYPLIALDKFRYEVLFK